MLQHINDLSHHNFGQVYEIPDPLRFLLDMIIKEYTYIYIYLNKILKFFLF